MHCSLLTIAVVIICLLCIVASQSIHYVGSEYDGSDSGARPDEAVSWGKISLDAK